MLMCVVSRRLTFVMVSVLDTYRHNTHIHLSWVHAHNPKQHIMKSVSSSFVTLSSTQTQVVQEWNTHHKGSSCTKSTTPQSITCKRMRCIPVSCLMTLKYKSTIVTQTLLLYQYQYSRQLPEVRILRFTPTNSLVCTKVHVRGHPPLETPD